MSQGRLVRRVPLASLLVVAGLIAVPSGASAATTIGSDLAPDPIQSPLGANVTDPRTIAHTALPGQQVSSPLDGVVVRWRVRSASTNAGGNPVRLKVIRPAASGAYTGINTSTTQTVPEGAMPTTFTFQTQQAILAGDLIALDISGPFGGFVVQTNVQTGVHAAIWQPMPLLDGQTRTPIFDPSSVDVGEHTFNADVEPDCDRDGLGDETQDTDLSSCAPGTTPTAPGTTPTAPGTTPTGSAPTLPGGAPATCRGLPATIIGTPGDDVRTGSQGQDVIAGLGGNDTLSGLAGNDVICGGAGKDTLKGGKGKDTLLGQKGNDTLTGGPGNDKLSGKKGKDKLIGGGGKDKLKGGGGRDVCIGGKGNDTASKCEVEKSI